MLLFPCKNCEGHIFIVAFDRNVHHVIWGHLENTGCDDPDAGEIDSDDTEGQEILRKAGYPHG